MSSRSAVGWVLTFALGAATAHPTEPKADAELLEFLGSIDGGEESWIEFLAKTNVKDAAVKPKSAQAKPVAEREAKHD